MQIDNGRPGGSGTSSNGNTAGHIFRNPEISAQIIGNILETLSCGFSINIEVFDTIENMLNNIHGTVFIKY